MDWTLKTLLPDSYKNVVEWNEVARQNPPTIEEQVDIVLSEIKELADAYSDNDLKETLDAIADIYFTAAYLEHLDPTHPLTKEGTKIILNAITIFQHACVVASVQEVIESNYTKFVSINRAPYKDSEDSVDGLIKMEEERLSREHNLEVKGYIINGYIVFRDENNKVRKPYCYTEPDIDAVISMFVKTKDWRSGLEL